MRNIRISNPNYRKWKQRQDERKFQVRLRSERNKVARLRRIHNKNVNIDKIYKKEFKVPHVFSIIHNPEETNLFFNEIIGEIYRLNQNENMLKKNIIFLLEMKETKELTGDALMYLLTIIKNTKNNTNVPINWIGTFPNDKEIEQILKNSGFLRYMKTSHKNLVQTNEHIQIKTGYGYNIQYNGKDIDIRKEIIDFTCDKLNKNKKDVNFLWTMLTEMITNISDHAYDDENIFEHRWYLFVENKKEKICYTFMDNGVGIPTTIKKKPLEYMLEKVINYEYKYIEAAVSGTQHRSKTKQVERGNGLPSIYEQFKYKKVDKLVIISNKAYFVQNKSKDLKNGLNGTIFYWEIKKEMM